MSNNKKILFVDIETCPNLGLFWRCGINQTISHDQIVQERMIIMIGYKWEHEEQIHTIHWNVNKKDRDEQMLKDFSKVYKEADMIVAQNGAHFDIPWIRGRLMILKLPPLPQTQLYDTLIKNRRYFNLNSYKQDYMAKLLGRKGKLKMDYEHWRNITLVNAKYKSSMNRMDRYLRVDVQDLEAQYQLTSKHIPQRVNGMVLNYQRQVCLNKGCNGLITKNGTYWTDLGRKQRWECNQCHQKYDDSRQLPVSRRFSNGEEK